MVILDPISNLSLGLAAFETKAMLMRLVDYLKANAITALFTSLTHDVPGADMNEIGISSLIDTWLALSVEDRGGVHERKLTIRKSRGMAHANHAMTLKLTDRGIELRDAAISQA